MGRYPEKKNCCSFRFCQNYLFCYLVLFQAVPHGIWFFWTRLQENYTSVFYYVVLLFATACSRWNQIYIYRIAVLWMANFSCCSGSASFHGKRELSGHRTNTPCLLPRVVGGKRVLSAICWGISTPCPSCPHLPLTRRTSSSTHGGDRSMYKWWLLGTIRQTQTDIQYETIHKSPCHPHTRNETSDQVTSYTWYLIN